MSSHEPPEEELRGPSGLTVLELGELLPLLEPLPVRDPEPEPPPTLWRVVPRLLFSIVFGVLAAMHAGIFFYRDEEPFNQLHCLGLVNSSGIFAITAVLCALAGAGLLSKLKQALRDRREGRLDSHHDSAAPFRSPGRG
ncbi:hypothetical protein [Rhizobacter sp. OV335]|uniref:hypothetical protein n=1 Tax=Rhizobacter sp. OV335 TaxID=1500264 RepID=UPI00092378C8|nr:hypothetical protein [Rhizobacter sp. OV335]SHL93472.1 hypothetical protein SAMN02787076_00061 [Rhizobacter sp. OV335]